MNPSDDAPTGPMCGAERCTNTLREHELSQYLCGWCVRTLRGWLAEIPAQMTVLRGSRQREMNGSDGRGGTRTPPLPGRPDTLNLLGPGNASVHDDHGDQDGPLPVATTLGGWVRVVCEERRLDGPERWTEEGMSGWLEPHLDWVAGQRWAPEMRGELGDMMAAVRDITRLFPRTVAVSRPCPRCQSLTLVAEDWKEHVACTTCGNLYTDAELCHDAPMTLARLQREQNEREQNELAEAEAMAG